MDTNIIDTHAHICSAEFDGDRADVLRRAEAAGVGAIIAVSENMADARRNLELAGQFPIVKPAAGIYPSPATDQEVEAMVAFIREKAGRIVAIGEVGLDFWLAKEEEEKERQRWLFGRFIDLARDIDLPVNVHSRSAGRHAVAMLLEMGATRVQLHAFDGKASAALPAVEAGYFFSIPPSLVRSQQKQKLLRHLPLSSLLLESDSPVLGPDPQARNEPANIHAAIDMIAAIKGVDQQAVIEAALANTERLYGEVIRLR